MNPEENQNNQSAAPALNNALSPDVPAATAGTPASPAPFASPLDGNSGADSAPAVDSAPAADSAISTDSNTTTNSAAETPSLDQVAADLTSVATQSPAALDAPTDATASTPDAATSATDGTATEPASAPDSSVGLGATAAPETSAAGVTTTPETTSIETPATTPETPATTPEAPMASETPAVTPVASATSETPVTSVTPETSVASAAPETSTVTSEASTTTETSAAATDTLAAAPETTTSTEPAPFAPVETPVIGPTSDLANISSDTTIDSTPVDTTSIGATSTVDTTSNLDSSVADSSPVEETNPTTSTDFTTPESTSSANFVGDAPEAPKPASSDDEEEPLKPADPVPGSIGSALVYSDTAPDHAAPVTKPKKQSKFDIKGNMKLIIIIIAAVVLVAVVVIVLLFIMNGNNSSKKVTTTPAQTTPAATEPTVSSLTCTLEGDGNSFVNYGAVVNGKEDIVAMYSDGELDSLGINMALNYENEDAAKSGATAAKKFYESTFAANNLTTDPFVSSYDTNGNTLTVTHQADGADIDSTNAKVLGLFVLRGEPITDIETLQDSYEEDGFTCVVK
ncbi:hypothetical protein IKE84_01905 [Candidatus Saccharibacteria bacterium]|nr:hypothetical protein [Candidatus Saccharibacteria bacterium]